MPTLKHIHTLERSKTNKEVYRCIDPDCSYFNRREMLIGKTIRCFKCHAPAQAMQSQLRAGQKFKGTKVLTCIKCSKRSDRFDMIAAESFVDDLFKEGA